MVGDSQSPDSRKKSGGRSPAQKGYRLENQTRIYLCEAGLDCKRVPLSGAGDEKGDLRLVTGWGQTLKGECKSRGELAKWIVNALGDHDFLVLKQDRGETLVMLRLSLFRDMAQ
jgi:hypothetical protein